MKCPICNTENRDDREACYHCDNDLSMLRTVVNRAKEHYNRALEHAERKRYDEAIQELRSALEMNRNFPSAHVVLGTIYAKTDHPDLAREAWEEALSLDPSLRKAHQYLDKLERVREALPAVRRLRAIAWVCGAVTLVAIVLAVFAFWRASDLDLRPLEAAVARWEAGEAGAALEAFRSVAESAPPSVAGAASLWERAVENNFEVELTHADRLIQRGELAEARGAIDALRSRHPGGDFADRLNALAARLRDAAFARWNEQAALAEAGKVSLDALREGAGALAATYPNDERASDTARRLERILANSAEGRFGRIREEYEASGANLRARRRLEELLRDHPDFQPAAEMLATLQAEEIKGLVSRCREAMERGATEQGATLLNEIEELARAHDAGAWSKTIESLRVRLGGALVDRERQRLADMTVEDLLADPAALTLASELPAEDRAALEADRRRAQQRLAKEAAEWMRKRDYRYRILLIDEADARRTVQLAPLVYEHYGFDWSRPYVLFYLAASQMRLGDEKEAARTLDRLRREFPESSYIDRIAMLRERAARRKDAAGS